MFPMVLAGAGLRHAQEIEAKRMAEVSKMDHSHMLDAFGYYAMGCIDAAPYRASTPNLPCRYCGRKHRNKGTHSCDSCGAPL